MLNRTQVMVLAFLAAAWVGAGAIVVLAPSVYDQAIGLRGPKTQLFEAAFLAALSLFLAVLAVGVVRRWRWIFWVMLVASLAGVLRPLASALELAGILPLQGPAWYVVLQGVIGVIQVAIGIAMIAGYRRGGPWAAF